MNQYAVLSFAFGVLVVVVMVAVFVVAGGIKL